jgi:nucleotide-binding universal stress UspA family protein
MKVLLGVGGSDDGLTALGRTIERTLEADDDLTVAVVENPATDIEVEAVKTAVEDRLAAAGLEVPVVHLTGHPGSQLVELAEREDFDRLVLGGGETSPLGKVSLGSIAEFVLLNATVSVTLVR